MVGFDSTAHVDRFNPLEEARTIVAELYRVSQQEGAGDILRARIDLSDLSESQFEEVEDIVTAALKNTSSLESPSLDREGASVTLKSEEAFPAMQIHYNLKGIETERECSETHR